jgi:aldose sugar dehydrogenase
MASTRLARLLASVSTEKEGTEQARDYWDPAIAPSGLALYTGNLFPGEDNSVFVGSGRTDG